MPGQNNNLRSDDNVTKTDLDAFLDHLAHLIARRHLERSAQDGGRTTKLRRRIAKKKSRLSDGAVSGKSRSRRAS
jgi:hypothetical protein